MELRTVMNQLDGSKVAARTYDDDVYTVYVSEDVEIGTYIATFHKDDMPAHEMVRFDNADEVVAYFADKNMSDGWTIEKAEG